MSAARKHTSIRTALVRAAAALGGAALLALGALWGHSYCLELPALLTQEIPHGKLIEDRDGRLLARTAADGVFRAPLSLDEAGPHLVPAMIAAEDKRFFSHPGVDPLSIGRASLQALYHGRIVSGASTITQQLARSVFERPKTLAGKWREMAVALKVERALSKEEILQQYLNRVHFGPNIIGARAAADHYFGKPLGALSLAEAATLAGLVRGPSLYDPRLRPELAKRRRNRVLARMVEAGFIAKGRSAFAQELPVEIHPRPPLPGAHHWVRVVARERQAPRLRTTLHGVLQRETEALVRGHQRALLQRGAEASAAAAIVLDNQSGEVLAYVGAPDFRDDKRGGQNDGVVALRQPGSTLKPLIYAQAIDELGMTPASLLPDRPLSFRTPDSFYSPRNFDRKFRGSVLFSRALANSLNVPAVYLLSRLGPGRALAKLRAAGLGSLTEGASYYGPALALGDGEVTLQELTAAYACLARGGTTVSPTFFLGSASEKSERVLSAEAAALITEILSDDAARREAFGSANALELPFPVAAKTGTSKGYRDTWTVGYTRGISVGVWVGNFDGRPTDRMTGATAAGPLFHGVMQASALHLGARVTGEAGVRPLHDVPLQQLSVCAETGHADDGRCATTLSWFAPGSEPQPAMADSGSESRLAVEYPREGMTFRFDPAIPAARQTLLIKASTQAGADGTLVLNGAELNTQGNQAEWALKPGLFSVALRLRGGAESAPVRFVVN